MVQLKRNSKRIAIDIAGFGLIILALMVGWLPGPGGIPMILAGLGLLSVNHAWARQLRDKLIANGSRLATVLFPNNRTIQLLYDLLAVALIVSIVLMLMASTAYLTFVVSGIVAFATVCILLINRQRGQWLKAKFDSAFRKA